MNPNDNLDEQSLRQTWDAQRHAADTDLLAEINEGIFELIRKGLIEVVPDSDPIAYRLVTGDPID